jgi:hypothetical protein
LGGGLQSWNEQQSEGINNNHKELRCTFLSSLSSLNYRKVVFGLGILESFLSFKVSRLCLVNRPRLGGVFPIAEMVTPLGILSRVFLGDLCLD